MKTPGSPRNLVLAAVAAIITTLTWSAPATADDGAAPTPASSLTTALPIPETDLVMDVPETWGEIPADISDQVDADSLFNLDIAEEDTLVELQSGPDESFAVMLISKEGPLYGTPVQELKTVERGLKISRWVTWVIGSGMEITRPTQAMDIEGTTAATMSFLSGQENNHTVMTMTYIVIGEETIFIVDAAPKGTDAVRVLDEMRNSIRLE